jgi:hypothetical protein
MHGFKGVRVSPPLKEKARRLAEELMRIYNLEAGGELHIESALHEGKGCASSSTDMVATARAIESAFGIRILRLSLARIIAPRAISGAIIEQVRSLLGHCMSLTRTGTSEMRAQASHGRRRESCFGVSGWAIEQTEKLAADGGGEVAETPRVVAATCDIVITMLPGPTEVEVVVSGRDGLLEGIRKSSLVVDMSTSSPSRDWLSKLQDRRRP